MFTKPHSGSSLYCFGKEISASLIWTPYHSWHLKIFASFSERKFSVALLLRHGRACIASFEDVPTNPFSFICFLSFLFCSSDWVNLHGHFWVLAGSAESLLQMSQLPAVRFISLSPEAQFSSRFYFYFLLKSHFVHTLVFFPLNFVNLYLDSYASLKIILHG